MNFVWTLVLWGAALHGAPANAAAIVRAVEAHYAHSGTLRAEFYERYRTGKEGGEAESGTVYFSKPGRMRWEYESPEKKLFLVDGKNVWFYVPADRTASRAIVNESSDWRTPLALLTGKAHLDRLCRNIELVAFTPDAAGETAAPLDLRDEILRCLPRESSDPSVGAPFREILFEVTPDYRLTRVIIREAGDVETEFRFGNWQENVAVPESKFHFEPPAGVAIVDEQDLAHQVH